MHGVLSVVPALGERCYGLVESIGSDLRGRR